MNALHRLPSVAWTLLIGLGSASGLMACAVEDPGFPTDVVSQDRVGFTFPGVDGGRRDVPNAPIANDGDFTILEAGSPDPDPPPNGPPPCEQVCAHVYQDCHFAFRTNSGQVVSEADCVAGCGMHLLNGAEACIATAECSADALTTCLNLIRPPDAMPMDPPPNPGGGSPLEDQILTLTNQARARGANCGGRQYPPAPPLTMNAQLRRAAQLHSQDMIARRFFDHNNPSGQTPFDRMRAQGYAGSYMGENIAAGNDNAPATMNQWMNSPGHCTNIMNPNYRELGVGYAFGASSQYRHYWTQNFGTR